MFKAKRITVPGLSRLLANDPAATLVIESAINRFVNHSPDFVHEFSYCAVSYFVSYVTYATMNQLVGQC